MRYSHIFITLLFQGRFMMRWVLSAVCLFFSGLTIAQQAPIFETQPMTMYRIGRITIAHPLLSLSFSTGQEACEGWTSIMNEGVQQNISTYKNPVYIDSPSFGPGCNALQTSIANPQMSSTSYTQDAAVKYATCPAGYTYYASNNICRRSGLADKPICKDACDYFGNPIDPARSAKVEFIAEELTTALALRRTFRSLPNIAGGPSRLASLYGRGWNSELTQQLLHNPVTGSSSSETAFLYRADGTLLTFKKNAAGSWMPETDFADYRLVQYLVPVGTAVWELTTAENVSERYDALGRLLDIRKDGTAYMTLIRDSVGNLQAIADRHERLSIITYTAQHRIGSIALPDGTQIVYGYDTNNRLVSVVHGGISTEYLYVDIAGANGTYLSGVKNGGVLHASFGYDTTGRAVSTEYANGVNRYSLTYTANGVSATTPNGSLTNIQYQQQLGSNLPTQRVDIATINGQVLTRQRADNIFDASNNLISQVTPTTLVCTYYASGTNLRIAKFEYPKTTTACPSTLTVATTSTSHLRAELTAWDMNVLKIQERKVLNSNNLTESKTTYTHNTRGQTTAMCQIDPNNPTAMAYVCGSATNAPVGVRQSTMTYCEQADVTAGTCPIVGLMLSSNGPRTDVSDISTYTYYPTDAANCATAPTTCAYRKGDLWKVTNALNHVMETTAYDGAGRVLQMKDANNVITDMQYHPRGWLTHRKVRGSDNATEADDAITTMDYDATGQVIKVTQPDGDFINFTYDAAHRLTGISDALNNSISYTLDNAGNRTAETTKDPSNVIKRSLSRVYDTLGRLQASKNAASATVATLTYDANDNLNTSTDGLNRITDQDVDPLNRLIKTIQDQGAGKINATTQFEYDARDNLTKVIDPKNLNTVYSYSGLNDLTQLSSPDTGSTAYTYDSAGNRKTQTDARNVTSTYSYDSANRLTQVSLPSAAQNVFFDYDATQADCQATETFTTGRLARIRDESGNTRYCYNRLGQSVRKVQSVTGGPNLSLGSTYNGANRMIAMTYPSGAIVTYLRNAKGQITGIDAKPTAAAAQVSLISNATYLPFGPLNTLTFGNSRVLTKAYDQNYDIDKVSDNSTTGLSQDSTVNLMGNITAITERTTATANTTRQLAYDNLDRLLSLKNGATNIQSFTYDATGNRLNKTLGTTVTTNTIAATSHRLTQDGATARTYDANGNTATIGVKGYVYDDRNRLRDYKNSGSTVTRTYRYNGKGERVSKVVSATSTSNRYFFYDEAGHLLGEYLANGTRVQEYVWLDDQLIAVLSDHDASTYQFVETDHLGTPRAVVHPVENNIVWRWNITNTAFGEHTATNNPDGDAVTFTFNLRYPGQYYDAESTLHYNYFRDYEPQAGRYVQSDPIGLAGGSSTYGYVNGRPLVWSDHNGLIGGGADTCVGISYEQCRAMRARNNPASPCKLSPKARKCMAKALKVSEQEVDSVRIVPDSLYARAHFFNWETFSFDHGATTRPGVIFTSIPCSVFGKRYNLMLHEYHHTSIQWASWGLTRSSYLNYPEPWEYDANWFADTYEKQFTKCMNGDC
jgi:RHS repeat-associated protein